MNLIEVFQKFPDHEACLEHLEQARWHGKSACPFCGSLSVARKADGARVGRWNCHDCHSSFNVLSGTIFQKTKVDLQKWFLGISLILSAKKSLSSCQLARDLDLNQKTAWYLHMRIRREMVDNSGMLYGIVEADEAYIGGRPRKGNRRSQDKPAPRGRATSKLPIIGAVERGGRVVARPAAVVASPTLSAFLSQHIDRNSLLITDEFKGYQGMDRYVQHATIDHSVRYSEGLVNTNTIEGFWSLLKRAWYGSHHHYSKAHALAYTIEACYKYNIRKVADPFNTFLSAAVAPA